MSTSSNEVAAAEVKKVEQFLREQQEVEAKGRAFYASVNSEFKKLDDFDSRLLSLRKELPRLKEGLAACGGISAAEKQRMIAQLDERQKNIADISALVTPESGGWFVHLFLGRVNSKLYREGERFTMKNEYEKYKRNSTVPFALLILLTALFPNLFAAKLVLLVWTLMFYVALALRENILRVNGSNIRPWWIFHHYLSIVVSLVLLLWPIESVTYQAFQSTFLMYQIAQLLVSHLQVSYQLGRLYREVAMGRASPMDITGEALPHIRTATAQQRQQQQTVNKGLLMLYPFVTIVQMLQYWCSFRLIDISRVHHFNEWQPICAGLLFAFLATGNLYATNKVYFSKIRAYFSLQKTLNKSK